MGETRVDLLHLLEDLRDAYPGPLEETILTEIVANALDSGAGTVRIVADPVGAAFTLVDDGRGMKRRELARYHDVAASTKTRGEGIGFAGVGIKLGLLVCNEVLTETRRGKSHVATRWHLASRHRAPWRWVPPPGLVAARGTGVRLTLRNPLSPLLDAGFLEAALRRHFEPLLDPAFDAILAAHYPRGVRFEVNGRVLGRQGRPADETAPIAVRLARQRKPSAVGYLLRVASPLPETERGIGVSTLGKAIKQGWDWVGVSPASLERVAGLVEVPELAGSLALNKSDFIRSGPRGAVYLAYRKAIQEAVSRQLALWGDVRDTAEEARRRLARPLERDLELVLTELAADFPLLATLVEQRTNGQRSLAIGRGAMPADAPLQAVSTGAASDIDQPVAEEPVAASRIAERPSPPTPSGGARPARLGLAIQLDSRPDDPELGRLVESTVWVNDAHPAYRRAVASRSEGYHVALAVALALAPLAVEPTGEHGFVTAFLARWGAALDRDGARRRRAR